MDHFADLNAAMEAGAARAVELAAQGNISLDYTLDSIRVVEQQLASLHDAIPKGFFARLRTKGPSDAEIHLMAMTLGAYVGEVLRRKFGGYWSEENSLDPGTKLPTLHFANEGGEVWPQIKVEKRLLNGPEDNVWDYANALATKLGEQRGDA